MTGTVIKDFAALRSAIQQGTEAYLKGDEISGDRDGFWHGSVGERRARLVQACLKEITDKDQEALLALAYFIFNSSSSRLSLLISQHMFKDGVKWISWDDYFTYISKIPETSTVFNLTGLTEEARKTYNDDKSDPLLGFHEAQAAKNLLNASAKEEGNNEVLAARIALRTALEKDCSLTVKQKILIYFDKLQNLFRKWNGKDPVESQVKEIFTSVEILKQNHELKPMG